MNLPIASVSAIPQTLGEQINLLRYRAGLTRHRLAEQAGVNPRTLRWIEERNNYTPKFDTVNRIYTALGYSLDPADYPGKAAPTVGSIAEILRAHGIEIVSVVELDPEPEAANV